MSEQFSRTERILGQEALAALAKKKVALFGLGGVGGYVAEALVRSGIGSFDLVDNDKVALSNLNRQIIASHKTVGRDKADVMKERILDINPAAQVRTYKCFYLPETAGDFDFSCYDYVVDAVDTVTAKIDIVMRAQEAGVPVISCMGTGNKLKPAMLEVADVYETSVCPLAKVMRHELKKRGVEKLKVVYSKEVPLKPKETEGKEEESGQEEAERTERERRSTPGSVIFVPAAAGLLIASEVVKDLL